MTRKQTATSRYAQTASAPSSSAATTTAPPSATPENPMSNFEAAQARLASAFSSNLKPSLPNVLSIVGVVVDLIEEMFPDNGLGEMKRQLFKDLLYFALPDDWVDRYWHRIESTLATVVKLKKLRAAFRAARG
ncbi:MAG: hypothetical protein PWP40_2105 [Rhodocyclaceae bacterium]|nr:hypothetical protein [Rhodocyclaceae bacterium]